MTRNKLAYLRRALGLTLVVGVLLVSAWYWSSQRNGGGGVVLVPKPTVTNGNPAAGHASPGNGKRVPPSAYRLGSPAKVAPELLGDDSLLSVYRSGAEAEVLAKLEGIGPGTNRRNLILKMFRDLRSVKGGYSLAEFEALVRLVDSLPYASDKSFDREIDFIAVAREQEPDALAALIRNLQDPSLRAGLAVGLGERVAIEGTSMLGPLIASFDDKLATEAICTWAGKLRKYQETDPVDFQGVIDASGLNDDHRAIAIRAYVSHLTQISGEALIKSSTHVRDENLQAALLQRGYKNLIGDDSLAGSAALREAAPSIPDSTYNNIVEDLVYTLNNANDLAAARQWADTVRDPVLRKHLQAVIAITEPNR